MQVSYRYIPFQMPSWPLQVTESSCALMQAATSHWSVQQAHVGPAMLRIVFCCQELASKHLARRSPCIHTALLDTSRHVYPPVVANSEGGMPLWPLFSSVTRGVGRSYRGGGGGTSNTWLPWQRCLPYEARKLNCAEVHVRKQNIT